MSTAQVQYLQKQLQRRDAQIRVLLAALDGCDSEKELSESVACAFAWDLAAEYATDYDPVVKAVFHEMRRLWDSALEAASPK